MLSYTLLTLVISWTLWALVAATGRDINTDLTVGIAYVLGGFGPALAGALLTRRDTHRAASNGQSPGLGSRILDTTRIAPRWWAITILLYPVTLLTAYGVLAILAPGTAPLFLPAQLLRQPPTYVVLHLLSIAVIGPISEEPGWRGYALDRLQARRSPLVASLLLGIVWWAWHLPLIAVSGSFLHGGTATAVFLAGYLGTVLLYSVLFTWVYNNTRRSVLATITMHFCINLATGLLVPPFPVYMVTTFLLIAIVTVIVVRTKMWRRDAGRYREPVARVKAQM